MNQANHISQDDLILLALQFLPEKELPDALAHVAHCDTCREELGRIQGDLALYALAADVHSPPAYARERLLRQVAKEQKLLRVRGIGNAAQAGFSGSEEVFNGGASGFSGGFRPAAFWLWTGWAVAAAMAAVAALQFSRRQQAESSLNAQGRELREQARQSARAEDVLKTLTDSRAQQVGIHLASGDAAAAPRHTPEAHAAYMADTGALVFFASNLQPLPAYKAYELWLLPANGHDPIAAGVFKPDANGNANVMMPHLPKGVRASGFGVTIEDEGGAKQPTLPILMAGS